MASKLISASHWGIFHPVVKDGVLVGIEPFEHDVAPSSNLPKLVSLPYSSSRIKAPAVRKSFLDKGSASRQLRGQDEWVEVSWETALDLASKEIQRIYETYGPSAVWGRSYGWMSAGKVNAAVPLVRRLLNLMGGCIETANSYSTAAIGTILPYVIGGSDYQSTSWDSVIKNSEHVVFWGCNPLITNDSDWSTTLHNSAAYIKELKKKGTKTTVVNPLYSETGQYLKSNWIAPDQGTDTALVLGLLHELEITGKADKGFLAQYAFGYDKLHDYIFGVNDGTVKSVQWAAAQTGVPEQTIKEFASELSIHRTMIMAGWGPQRARFGEQFHWALWALACALGQIGLPGGGIGCNYHYCNGGSPVHLGGYLDGISARVAPVRSYAKGNIDIGQNILPVARITDCLANPGKTIDFNGRKVTYPDVKLIVWAGGNPFAHQPQTNQLQEAWRRPETVIVVDQVWSATARQADIVLPACTFLERDDISDIGTYTTDGIVAIKKAIEPLYQSKTDFWIMSQLAKRLGFEQQFTEGLSEEDWIKMLFHEYRQRGLEEGIAVPEFNEFWEQGYFLTPKDPEYTDYIAFKDFRQAPGWNPLDTESGKIQLFSPRIAAYGYDDCKGHPTYFVPPEKDKGEGWLTLLAPKSIERLHSQLDEVQENDLEQKSHHEPLLMNPSDAKTRKLETGDIALVSNERGKVLVTVSVTANIKPGSVAIKHGAWYEPLLEDGEWLDVHGNSNTLTLGLPTSKLANGNIASGGKVQVTKYDGKEIKVTVHQAPIVTKPT